MRVSVPLRQAYKLINHGPTALVSASHGGRENVMAAAWVMALDFDPPKVAAVIAQDTFTRALIDASGSFCLSLPLESQAALTMAVGSTSGRDLDKFERYQIARAPGTAGPAPLIEGCAAWLECRVLPAPEMQARYDLFAAEVLAAWADDSLFYGGEWHFPEGRRTLHHMARGVFFATGPRVEAKAEG